MAVLSNSNIYYDFVLGLLVLFDLISVCLFFSDKRRSLLGHYRISERALLFWSFLGGIGGLCGMIFFRHKTNHLKFKITIPIFALLNLFEYAAVLALR